MTANSYTVSLLEEVAELIQGYVDVCDGSDGPRPNQAMIAANKLNEAIEFLKATSDDSRRLDYLEQTLYVDRTGDDAVYALFIPGSELMVDRPGYIDLRQLVDESMALSAITATSRLDK